MSKSKKKIKNLTQTLSIPQDVINGSTIITIIGKTEIIVENYRGIIEYNDKVIKIGTKNGSIEFQGERFLIEYYTNDEMKIRGRISEIKYS